MIAPTLLSQEFCTKECLRLLYEYSQLVDQLTNEPSTPQRTKFVAALDCMLALLSATSQSAAPEEMIAPIALLQNFLIWASHRAKLGNC